MRCPVLSLHGRQDEWMELLDDWKETFESTLSQKQARVHMATVGQGGLLWQSAKVKRSVVKLNYRIWKDPEFHTLLEEERKYP